MSHPKTERELVEECNQLAHIYYEMQGCKVGEDYKFYEAHHPAEVSCWEMAVAAYGHIRETDIEDCLIQMEDEAAK